MNRKQFTPEPGVSYRNRYGGIYECVETFDAKNGGAVMRNQESGLTLNAYEIWIYDDGSIDWVSTYGGHIAREKVSGQKTPPCPQDVFRNAIQTWGKEAQTDMMIEEMAELTKEILNERRGRDHNIAEEMADVKIMLAQMEIIFQNAGEVEQKFREKVARLDRRLQERRGGAAHE